MRSVARYAETNAITRALLSELLTAQHFAGLAQAPSPREAWAVLRKTSYGTLLPDFPEADALALNGHLRRAAAMRFNHGIRALRGKPRAVADILLSRWELDDLERVLRLWHSRESSFQPRLSFYPSVHAVPILDVLAADSIGGVAEALKRTPYFEPIRDSAEIYEAEGTIFHVEAALEKDYYARLLASLEALGKRDAVDAERIVAAEIDLLNLSWLARLCREEAPEATIRASLIAGPLGLTKRLVNSPLSADALAEVSRAFLGNRAADQGEDVSDIERIAALESLLTEMAAGMARKLLSGFPFSIACVFAFYLLIRLEFKNLGVVFAGKAVGAGAGEIRARLFGIE